MARMTLRGWRHAAIALLVLTHAAKASAFGAHLRWLPVLDARVAGYNVYVRPAGVQYGAALDAGSPSPDTDGVLSFTVHGLAAGQTFHFAVTAYTGDGDESRLSQELTLSKADACSADRCTGRKQCDFTVLPDGTACDDGDLCTRTDSCVAGACTGADPVRCAALDQCHDPGVCDPASGLCSNPTMPDGSPCDDGDLCTQGNSCEAGICTGGSAADCSRDPVFFVHGYARGSTSWNTLIGFLEAAGYPPEFLRTIDLVPNTGPNEAAAELQIAPAIESFLGYVNARLSAQGYTDTPKTKVDIISHDMGALSTRWYAATVAPERVNKWISIAGANHGTDALCPSVGDEGSADSCPAYSTDPASTMQVTLNGQPFLADVDETPYGAGIDSPGVSTVPPDETRYITYFTIRTEPDRSVDPDDSALVDGAGWFAVAAPEDNDAWPFVENPPGNFLVTSGLDHDTMLSDPDVMSLVALLLSLEDGASCGDGFVDQTHGEACDDGNLADGDGCDRNCTPTGCGNGIVTAGEQCDDGNALSCDGCSGTCETEFDFTCTLMPVADTYIEAGTEATWDHGASDHLDVDGRPRGITYLKFDLRGLRAPVAGATLVLYSTNSSDDGGTIYPVADSTWPEGTGNGIDESSIGSPGLKWTDVDTNDDGLVGAADGSAYVPDFAGPIVALGPVRRYHVVSVNVTTAFEVGANVYTLAIRNRSTDGATYSSREHPSAGHRPLLRLQLEPHAQLLPGAGRTAAPTGDEP